ncbi:MAG TPA: hypothetical protein VND98_03150 [Solirubrobacterales bacterium]|nr:hypothetical protein [Solirubrobacterales bacterium]
MTRTNALIGALVLLVAALMLVCDGTRDGDLYLQLLGGRLIAEHGFTSVDPFRTIAQGTSWLNQQWLTELIVYRVAQAIGVTGLTIAYAGLLATPLALLLWLCRRKGPLMMAVLTALYCPGLWEVVHPRAAGFTLLAFSVLASIVALTWLAPRSSPGAGRRFRYGIPAILLVFALWANLHGGFIAGLLLIGAVTVGLGLDRLRGLSEAVGAHRLAVLCLTGVLAAVTITVATPLGAHIWAYLLSFRNPAIAFVSSEWEPSLGSPPAMAYLTVAAVFSVWLWLRTQSPRPLGPLLVTAGFLVFGVLALRNLIFVGPALALQIAVSAPDRETIVPRSVIGLAVAASAVALATWAATVGPAHNEAPLGSRLVDYATEHPPREGHIASYASVGSYMLWHAPQTPVELDGWLEHFSPVELRGTYAVLDGRRSNPTHLVSHLHIGAVIADRRVAIAALLAHGFTEKLRTPEGVYLVRRATATRHRQPAHPTRF